MTPEERKKWVEERDAEDARRKAFHDKLKKDFPILWRPPPEGKWFPAPDGTPESWQDAIYECSADITKAFDSVKEVLEPDELPYVVQVKEKFGSLRFYIHNCPEAIRDEVDKAISNATAKTDKLCSKCGCGEGELRTHYPELPEERFGWILTLCESCWYDEALKRALKSGSKPVRTWYYEKRKALKAAKKKAHDEGNPK